MFLVLDLGTQVPTDHLFLALRTVTRGSYLLLRGDSLGEEGLSASKRGFSDFVGAKGFVLLYLFEDLDLEVVGELLGIVDDVHLVVNNLEGGIQHVELVLDDLEVGRTHGGHGILVLMLRITLLLLLLGSKL
jgi:hypothetical protein